MSLIQALLLGIVQGLTEFLPVSSSGHLVLFQRLIGLREPELLFDICVHVGTLAAVLIVFRRDLWALIESFLRLPATLRSARGVGPAFAQDGNLRLLAMIVLGSLPTALMGVFLSNWADQLFSTTWLVGITLLCTGTFLWLLRGLSDTGRMLDAMHWRDAVLIGVAQGLAIMPGISRSGATIAAALFLGLNRELAGRFSFLLAVPAILGALLLGMDGDVFHTTLPAGMILAGSLSAAVIGYIALTLLLRIVKNGQLHRFAPYCWSVGAMAVLLSFI